MSVAIETKNLGRYFGDIKAVDGVTFQVDKGEVLGFMGPNGAGKSTTMKMLTGFLIPSFGEAWVGGFNTVQGWRDARRLIGYLPENAPLYDEMEVGAFLKFVAEVRGLEAEKKRSAVSRVIELTNIEDVVRQRMETLSKGFKRRVALAQALIHDPAILILDEPTDGLDPNQKYEVRCLINRMASEKCIILSTHILEEVDEVCSRMVIISRGKLVADGTPEELRKHSKSYGAVTIGFPRSLMPEDAEQVLRGIPGVGTFEQRGLSLERVSFTMWPEKGEDILFSVVREIENRQWPCTDLRLESGQLDEVFREFTTTDQSA